MLVSNGSEPGQGDATETDSLLSPHAFHEALAREAASYWRAVPSSWVPEEVADFLHATIAATSAPGDHPFVARSRTQTYERIVQRAREMRQYPEGELCELWSPDMARERAERWRALAADPQLIAKHLAQAHQEWTDSAPARNARHHARVESRAFARREAERRIAERERELHEAEVAMLARRAQEQKDRELAEAALLEQERAERERADAERRARWLARPAPAPDPQPFGVSHEGAERLVTAWMRHLGALDAETTRVVGDGGIDVVSEKFVVQVKNYAGSIAVVDVRALYGVAVAEGKHPLMFTSGTMTVEGLAFANRVRMAALQYSAEDGTLRGLNPLGEHIVEHGLDGYETATSVPST